MLITEGTERDLTEAFLDYREAMRHVWNGSVRRAPDGAHDFINIDRELFYALVLKQFDDVAFMECVGRKYYPALHVRFEIPPIGHRDALVRRYVPPSTNVYDEVQLTRADIELRYIAMFDWRDPNDRIDGQFVEAAVIEWPELPNLVGTEVLTDVTAVRLVGVARAPSPK